MINHFYDHREGTTDTTRTMHFGTPSQHEKECFTRVLKVDHNFFIICVAFPITKFALS